MPLLPKSRKARRRFVTIAAAAPVLMLAAGLSLYAMGDAAVFFYSPKMAADKSVPPGRTIRLGGLVAVGSVAKRADGQVEFKVTDQVRTDRVVFRGDLPDLFREGQGVVTEGAFRSDGLFVAREVLAKHDERYMPKEVADALKRSGQWRGEGGVGGQLFPGAQMIDELGAFALFLALALSLAQIALSGGGRLRHDATLRGAGEGAAVGAFAAVVAAFAALMHAFVTSDFSLLNVAANSHTDKPLLYKVAAVWGSHEGSMLLWCLALTGFGGAVAVFGRGLPSGLKALTVMTQGVLGALFIGYTAFASNPFVRLARPPVQGASLNPILQDPFLAIHPPFLYSGYVGFSVVFSLAVAALIEGRVDAAWARWVRPWTLAAWSFLTVGITLGSFWAYYELGWGGWWFWDPVENASFMPWLLGAALLHSAIVTEKRGALAGWTVFLALAAFTFSMLGAFLVRSGVLTSVHAFAVDPKRGVILLIILALTSGSAFALFVWRAPALKGQGGLFAPVSRESALVVNNLFLSAATLTVVLGTLYPLALQALTGQAISVGAPYYALTFAPMMGACLIVLPAGPLLAWKRGELLGALQRLWVAALVAAAAALLAFFALQPGKIAPAVGAGLGLWLILGSLSEVLIRVRAGSSSAAETARRALALPRAQWGMTLAHAGLGVFVLGAAFETSGRVEAAEALALGQTLTVGQYVLTLQSSEPVEGPNYTADRATLSVTGPGGRRFQIHPERRFYPANRQTTSEVAIARQGVSDLYVVVGERRDGARPSWLIRAYWNPLARLIFAGPLLMALAGLISLSDPRLRLAAGAKRAHRASPGLPRPVQA